MNENMNNTNPVENNNEQNTAQVPNQDAQQQYQQPQYQQPPYQQPYPQQPADSGSFLWSLLGFIWPLVGLILYLVWKDSKPVSSKQAGKGALIGVIVQVVCGILLFILSIVSASMMGGLLN